MRKRNKTKQLNRVYSHRKAMLRNLVTSLFDHERIITTRARSKVLRSYAEKLITRARRHIVKEISKEAILHNKRLVMREISNRDIVVKLFEDIAPRYKERPGGYTRIIHLHERPSDSAKMSIIELVDKKEKIAKPMKQKKEKKSVSVKKKVEAERPKDITKESKKEKPKKGKWFLNFRNRRDQNR